SVHVRRQWVRAKRRFSLSRYPVVSAIDVVVITARGARSISWKECRMSPFKFVRIELLEPRQLFSIAVPDHIVVVVAEDRFSNAVGDTAHLPYVNQLASTGLVYT